MPPHVLISESDTNISSAGPVSNEDSRHSEGKSQFSNTDQNAKEKKQAQTSMHEQFKEASMDKGKPYAVNPGTGAQAAQ
jgi:hypothetical protein